MTTPQKRVPDVHLPAPLPPSAGDFARLPREIQESTAVFARSSLAKGTIKNYGFAWKQFLDWCVDHGASALPAEPMVVAAYLTYRAKNGKKVSTIKGDLSAIALAHKLSQFPIPSHDGVVQTVMDGIEREVGVAPEKKAPMAASEIERVVTRPCSTPAEIRDRAILLLGFVGAFRRSELVGIKVEDIEIDHESLTVWIPKSKTDQRGEGRWVIIPYGDKPETCPVKALRFWLSTAGITEGPIFRSIRHGKIGKKALCAKWVERIVKDLIKASPNGLDASVYAAHSLRSGFVSAAINADRQIEYIAKHLGHKNVRTTYGYLQVTKKDMLKSNVARGLL